MDGDPRSARPCRDRGSGCSSTGHCATLNGDAPNPDISSGRGITAEDWARQVGLDRLSGRDIGVPQIIEGSGYAGLEYGDIGQLQAHLHAAQGSGQGEIVEIAEMTDAKHLALQFAQARTKRHVESFENDLPHLV